MWLYYNNTSSPVTEDHAQNAIGFAPHDHVHCRHEALAVAEEVCAARKLRMTPVRRKTLEILLENHNAMGAYDVLGRLDDAGLGSKPPIAYRALSFLVENGFAHRIERLNAFVACAHPGGAHDPAFLICRSCGTVAEAGEAPLAAFRDVAGEAGFKVERVALEAEGLCPECAAETA